MYIRVCCFNSLRRLPPRSAVLNLELCLPCIQFFARFNLLDHHIFELILPRRSDDLSRQDCYFFVFLGFFFFFSFTLLITLLQYYIRKYTYLLTLREPVDITLRIIPRIHNVSFVCVT